MQKKDYCPNCRKRTVHIKVGCIKLCKRCGYQEKVLDPWKLIR